MELFNRKDIICFLPDGDTEDLAQTVKELKGCGIIKQIFVVCTKDMAHDIEYFSQGNHKTAH